MIGMSVATVKDKTKACYNCGCYVKFKKIFRCAVDNVRRGHNTACCMLDEFFFKQGTCNDDNK